jgi:hypothetical protein
MIIEENMKDRAKELMKKYPEFFKNCGIECGNGWLELIRFVCEMFRSYITRNDISAAEFRQIKEKFGYLRIYFSASEPINAVDTPMDKRIHNEINLIEELSSLICEDCGRIKNADVKVTTAGPGWIRTLCEDCRKKGYEK